MGPGGNWGIPRSPVVSLTASAHLTGFPVRLCWLESPKPGKIVIHKFFCFANRMTWGMFHTCDICAANVKITSLTDHQRRLITKLHQIQTAQYANYNLEFNPKRACDCCLLKIEQLLHDLVKNLFNIQHLYPHGNMQKTPQEQKKNEDDNGPAKIQPHLYNCDCPECQIKFGSLPLLVQVIEGQEKTNQGTSSSTFLCDNTSNSSTDLKNSPEPCTSYETSINRKSISCPHCNKIFTHRGDLNKHVRTHTGEQPYTCIVCNRKFAHTSNLNRHLKVHSGDRPFSCEVCNKNFSRKDKLDNHKKTKLCKKFSEKS